jgi:hypothetical protein
VDFDRGAEFLDDAEDVVGVGESGGFSHEKEA